MRLKVIINKWLFITLGVLATGVFLFYWFEWRPSQIIKTCHQQRIAQIDKRHRDNVNYFFPSAPSASTILKEIDSNSLGKNLTLWAADENARLDVYWGNVTFENCLNEQGIVIK